ncbi:hypothetical protein DPMN_156949 [Dreissena polymorpha]|uniref:Uncharacterized protein n=1 Tax=Dreissena polymorpha TaxID=45954 RepID=A0A9D4FRL0_DREPO|nr:hypothetical protein DPMN_156949 [Dreissena polymorpha]
MQHRQKNTARMAKPVMRPILAGVHQHGAKNLHPGAGEEVLEQRRNNIYQEPVFVKHLTTNLRYGAFFKDFINCKA